MSYEYVFKYILVGEIGVGKSSLLLRFSGSNFDDSYGPTVGVEFISQVCEINGQNVKLQIWDTAGQEEYRSIARQYYRSVAGILLVYDITNRGSFEKIDSWILEAKQECTKSASFLLIGNKADLDKENRVVSMLEGKALADKHGIPFIETSAKDNMNVREAFSKASLEIMKKVNDGVILVDEIGTEGVKVNRNFKERDLEANREKLHSLKSDYAEESKCGSDCCY